MNCQGNYQALPIYNVGLPGHRTRDTVQYKRDGSGYNLDEGIEELISILDDRPEELFMAAVSIEVRQQQRSRDWDHECQGGR